MTGELTLCPDEGLEIREKSRKLIPKLKTVLNPPVNDLHIRINSKCFLTHCKGVFICERFIITFTKAMFYCVDSHSLSV